MKKIILATTLAAFALPMTIAHAEEMAKPVTEEVIKKHKKSRHNGLKFADKNGDGVVDFDEFLQRATERAEESFAKIDKDGDGTISKNEYMEFATENTKTMFERMDRNGDGVLTDDDMKMEKGKKHRKNKANSVEETSAEDNQP